MGCGCLSCFQLCCISFSRENLICALYFCECICIFPVSYLNMYTNPIHMIISIEENWLGMLALADLLSVIFVRCLAHWRGRRCRTRSCLRGSRLSFSSCYLEQVFWFLWGFFQWRSLAEKRLVMRSLMWGYWVPWQCIALSLYPVSRWSFGGASRMVMPHKAQHCDIWGTQQFLWPSCVHVSYKLFYNEDAVLYIVMLSLPLISMLTGALVA